MRTLVLTSHRLSDYQRCARLYQYSSVEHLRPAVLPKGIKKGSAITKFMEKYYQARIDGDLTREAILKWADEFPTQFVPDFIDRQLTTNRLISYYGFYRHESWKPVAVEKGFSRILWENKQDMIVYEGCPDLIVQSGKDHIVVDHKSQAFEYKMFAHNNQTLGYCWATGMKYFAFNIIGLQKTGKPEEWFRRHITPISDADVKDWEMNTIEYGRRILEDVRFPKSYQCLDKFGVCWYNKICALGAPSPQNEKLIQIMKSHEFVVEHHESWNVADIGFGRGSSET